MSTKQKWLLAGIIFLAVAFRFYQIKFMPGGLFPDEAANGLDINLLAQGHLQPFFERGNGREALFFYTLWGSVAAFGRGPWQHHIVSAAIGVLAVICCFLASRQLFFLLADDASRKKANVLALLAAFFMAANTWHIVLSRTAFRANLIPLFTAFTFYFLLKAIQAVPPRQRLYWAIAAGSTFALGFYTYIAYRIMAPILLVLVLWPLAVDFFRKPRLQQTRRWLKPVAGFIIAFVIIIAPLAYYFQTHPGSFIGRSGQVSVFNPDLNHGRLLATVAEVSKESLAAFFTQGDLNWRHNISGFPFLSQFISPFFALGLLLITLLAIRYAFQPRQRPGDWKYFLLAGWFWGMLLPVITTAEGIPHGLRSIGLIPAVFIITAWGLYQFVKFCKGIIDRRHLESLSYKKKIIHGALVVLCVVFFASIIVQSYSSYFVYAANSPANFYAFRSDLTTVSDYLKAHGSKTNTYLILDKFSVQTTDYLTTYDASHPQDPRNQPYVQVDPEDSWKLPKLKSGDIIIFCQSSLFDTKKFKQYHPEAHLSQQFFNQFGETVMAVYKVK